MNENTSNKTIVKNTLFLYGRMIITMLIGLFTSRYVLNALGFTDYGIYNVVGGVVTMLAFLQVGMNGASQRFISYEMGRGDINSLRNVFCNSVIAHNTIAFIALLFFETIGLWVVNYKLVIPVDRLFAANWVFQCSIITFAVSVISVPYTACVVAHEKMGQFAYISILDTVIKFLIAVGIMYSSSDRLIIYATLILADQILVRMIYSIYCKRKFEECTFKYKLDKGLFKQMFAFAGWGFIGNMGFSLKDQLSNILLNMFFGPAVNAARGVSSQVMSIIVSFAGNFTMALNPQITKQYAAGNISRSKTLAIAGSKYAFYLLMIIGIPFIINEHYVLRLWLGDVPEYTDYFVCISLISSSIYSMSHTISTGILATGHVKWFQSLLAITLLLEVPIGYVVLKLGGTPYMAVIPGVFTCFLSIILRIVILHRLIPEYSISEYVLGTILRCFIVAIIAFVPSYYIHSFFDENFFTMLATAFISAIIVIFCVLLIGLNSSERHMVLMKVPVVKRYFK